MAGQINNKREWDVVINSVIDASLGGCWQHDKYVVFLHGVAGCGKTVFCDLLAKQMRKQAQGQVAVTGLHRQVRICSSSFYQVFGRNVDESTELARQDILQSTQVADVVIVDDRNLTRAAWAPTVAEVLALWTEKEWQGVMIMVTFTCRDEQHAIQLSKRTWQAITDDDARRQYYQLKSEDLTEFSSCLYTVDPDV